MAWNASITSLVGRRHATPAFGHQDCHLRWEIQSIITERLETALTATVVPSRRRSLDAIIGDKLYLLEHTVASESLSTRYFAIRFSGSWRLGKDSGEAPSESIPDSLDKRAICLWYLKAAPRNTSTRTVT